MVVLALSLDKIRAARKWNKNGIMDVSTVALGEIPEGYVLWKKKQRPEFLT